MQHGNKVALHVGQFALGHADLVAALARHDDARRAFRVFVEGDEIGGEPPHRPHKQVMQRQVDQQRGQARDQQRHHEHVAREAVHRLPQRLLVDHDLDELRAARRLARPRGWRGCRAPASSRTHRRSPRHTVMVAHVDVVVDLLRQVGAREQPALLAHLDGDRARADARTGSAADSVSGTMPDGAASSTSAAVLAAARRSLRRLTRKLAIAGT